jgi:transcription elongation factor GreB
VECAQNVTYLRIANAQSPSDFRRACGADDMDEVFFRPNVLVRSVSGRGSDLILLRRFHTHSFWKVRLFRRIYNENQWSSTVGSCEKAANAGSWGESMSKAFTRESDAEEPEVRRPLTRSVAAQRYLTAGGARRMAEELKRLDAISDDNPRAAELRAILEGGEVVRTPTPPWEKVKFGAEVTVRDRRGAQLRYRIVSADEMDLEEDWISSRSPLARALLNASVGQRVRYETPGGPQEIEILKIEYPD